MKEENMIAQKLITVGENENTVFRSCKDGIHTNVFETICAFLNTRGGTLLLGVDESGEVYGFKERAIPDIIQALKMATQNADTFQPPFEMEPVREIVDGKYILVLNVPVGIAIGLASLAAITTNPRMTDSFIVSQLISGSAVSYTHLTLPTIA